MGKITGSRNRDGVTKLIVSGDSAGDITVTGIKSYDSLISVLHDTASAILVDLTSEFSITADDTINNTDGTDTSGDKLVVRYNSKN